MATFEGTYTDTLTVKAPLAAVRAHFAAPATITAHTKDLEKADVDGEVIRFLLTKQDYPGVGSFQGSYACRYSVDADGALVWSPVGDGNTRQSGRAVFRRVDDTTTAVDYTEHIEIDMDVPALMAGMLKLVVGPMLQHEMAEYAKRVVKSAPTG